MEEGHVYDLLVVGAGPAGLAASVYAASEGLDVLTVDLVRRAARPGPARGSRTTSASPPASRGRELTERALLQAQKFGASITVPCTVALARDRRGGARRHPGRRYPAPDPVRPGRDRGRLPPARRARLRRASRARGSTTPRPRWRPSSAAAKRSSWSAAATPPGRRWCYLANYARRVHLLVRKPDLGAGMSRYLVDRIESLPNVTVHCECRGDGAGGQRPPGRGADHGTARAGTERLQTSSLFLFIGADANTAWLRGCVELDGKGFVLHRHRAAAGHGRSGALARGRARALPAGDEPARRVRGRRRAERVGEALRVGGGRGRDGGELRARAHRAAGGSGACVGLQPLRSAQGDTPLFRRMRRWPDLSPRCQPARSPPSSGPAHPPLRSGPSRRPLLHRADRRARNGRCRRAPWSWGTCRGRSLSPSPPRACPGTGSCSMSSEDFRHHPRSASSPTYMAWVAPSGDAPGAAARRGRQRPHGARRSWTWRSSSYW